MSYEHALAELQLQLQPQQLQLEQLPQEPQPRQATPSQKQGHSTGGGNSADVDFESAWVAARNKQRTAAREELASLADIIALMKIQKS